MMLSPSGTLAAPFPYFGGKSGACAQAWAAMGNPDNYVEPFAGSLAMLLGRPQEPKTETVNDKDGFVANFWRAVSSDAEAVANYADWPVNEIDLFARHSWLVRQAVTLTERLEADPDFYDAKIAGWWCWGACNWIGDGWCSGEGPWFHDGERLVDRRQLPDLSAVVGINRKLPHLGDAGPLQQRTEFIRAWFLRLMARTRHVRVACGDWRRVLGDSVTVKHGLTGVFLDPPYTKGAMDYAAGGVGGEVADAVREWCLANGDNPLLRIVLCGHKGEHDALLSAGWQIRTWQARKGYAVTDEARQNTMDETLYCSPHCVPAVQRHLDLFDNSYLQASGFD